MKTFKIESFMAENFGNLPILINVEKQTKQKIQTQKIENLSLEFRPEDLFTHQKSNKGAKNLHGTSNFHRKRELIE